jgi:hypothetical protein
MEPIAATGVALEAAGAGALVEALVAQPPPAALKARTAATIAAARQPLVAPARGVRTRRLELRCSAGPI